MLSFFNVQAGIAAAALCFAGFGIAAAVALVTAPLTPRLAVARTVDIANSERARAIGSPEPFLVNALGETALHSRPVATILRD